MSLAAFKKLIRRHTEIGIFLIAAVLIVVFTATSDGKWANLYNIGTILQVTATLGLITVGIALVIGTGEIDISVGSIFGIGSLTYLWLAVRGGTSYHLLGGGDFLGFNTGFYWLLGGLAVLTVALRRTPWGNHVLAVGGSANSAHSRGIRVGRIKMSVFVVCGALAGLAGSLEAGKLGFADGSMGRLMELQAIASCVLGGCLLAGGRISLVGAIVGAFVLSSIQSYLVVMGVRPQWFLLLLGLIVVLAALGDRSLRQWAQRH